jgi:hypothetical protein
MDGNMRANNAATMAGPKFNAGLLLRAERNWGASGSGLDDKFFIPKNVNAPKYRNKTALVTLMFYNSL